MAADRRVTAADGSAPVDAAPPSGPGVTGEIAMQDDHHFDFAGQKLWAERGVEIMSMRGWLPWDR
jgi:hypothetical protein